MINNTDIQLTIKKKKEIHHYFVIKDLIIEKEGKMKSVAQLVLVIMVVMAIMTFTTAFVPPPSCCPDVIECCGIDGGRKILKP